MGQKSDDFHEISSIFRKFVDIFFINW